MRQGEKREKMTSPPSDFGVFQKITLFPFKVLILFAISMALFCMPGYSQTAVGPNFYDDPSGSEIQGTRNPNSTLSILSWNIYLLPWIVPFKSQCKRAKAIAEVIAELDYDVIVIQEAFHNRARKILIERLLPHFPYQIEPQKGRFLKFNSGVFIISKIPMRLIDQIQYKECKLFFQDCRANKGATMVALEKDNQQFHLIATHLQAERGARFDSIRESQFREIYNRCIVPNNMPNIPVLVTGDLNTRLSTENQYNSMLQILNVKDGKLTGEFKFTYGGVLNDLKGKAVSKGKLLDYVLIDANGTNIKPGERKVKVFQKQWKKGKKDLSDHYAVEAILKF